MPQSVPSSLRSRVNGCGNPSSLLLVIARGFSPTAIRFSLKGITDSFTLRAQNDKSFCHCERRKVRGNPFSLLRVSRILSRCALRMTSLLSLQSRVNSCGNPFPSVQDLYYFKNQKSKRRAKIHRRLLF